MSAWYVLVVLALTAYRVTRLAVRDDFPPVLWLRDRLVGGWRRLTPTEWETFRQPGVRSALRVADVDTGDGQGKQAAVWVYRKAWVPGWLAELLGCPWCVSAYVSGALTAATDLTVGVPVPWLTAGAVWALAAMLASRRSL